MIKYKIVSEKIIEDINNGIYKEGDNLPSEKNLSEFFGVSVNTIRKSLSDLIYLGYVVSRQGSGYYINKVKNYDTLTLKSLKKVHENENPTSKIISFEIIQANEVQAEKLNIDVGEAIYNIKRIRYLNNIPKQLENTFVPVRIFPKLNKEVFEDSFYSYIEKESNLKVSRASKDISAIKVDEQIAKYLDLKVGDVALTIDNYGYLNDGTQFEYSYNIHRDKYFSIHVNNI